MSDGKKPPCPAVSVRERADGTLDVIVDRRRAATAVSRPEALALVRRLARDWPPPRRGHAFWPNVVADGPTPPKTRPAGFRLVAHDDGAAGVELLDLTAGQAIRASGVGGSHARYSAREAVALIERLLDAPTQVRAFG